MSTATITNIDGEAFAAGFMSCAAWCAWYDSDGAEGEYSTEELWHLYVESEDIDYRNGEEVAALLLSLAGPEVGEALLPDVIAFWRDNAADLLEAEGLGRDAESLGHDFYLSRCGHGCGFWDRGLGELGDRLHAAAKVYGDCGITVYPVEFDSPMPPTDAEPHVCTWGIDTY